MSMKNIQKAKSGIKVSSERWDPNLQMWVLDEGMPAKKMQPQKVEPFSMAENPYAGVFNQNQSDNTFFKPFNEVNYDGVITPNYMRTEFNPQTNKWDKVNQVDRVELQPQYTGDWSNNQRKAYEEIQPEQIGSYKTIKGKRKSRYNTEYDDMFEKGGVIPRYFSGGELEAVSSGTGGGLSLPVDGADPTSIDPQLIGDQSHGVSQMDLQAIENPNQVNQIQPQNNLDAKGYQQKQTQMKKVGTGFSRSADIMDNISAGLQNFTKGTIMAGNALAMNVLGDKQRDERLDREYQKPNYNAFAYGTGSQAIAKHGMSIPNEGTIDNLSIIEGGNAEVISDNPYTPETIQYNGQSHDNGGITIDYNGTPVEVEGGETQTGNVVFGNMKIPGTNTKFKDASKQLAKEEQKASKILSTGEQLLNIEPINAYRTLKANSGKLLTEIADKKLQEAAKTKEHLSFIQDMMLKGKEQSKMKNGGLIPIAEDGKTVSPDWTADYVSSSVRQAAMEVGIDPNIYERLAYTESGFRPGAKGPKTSTGTAYGHVQFLPETAKEYGLTEKQLKSKDKKDIDAVSLAGAKHLKKLVDKYDGDYDYALMAYNAGEGSKKTGKGLVGIKKMVSSFLGKPEEELTGREVALGLQQMQEDNPTTDKTRWKYQTNHYVNNIMTATDKAFYGDGYGLGKKFNDDVYQGKDVSKVNQNTGEMEFNEVAVKPTIETKQVRDKNDFGNWYTQQMQPNVYNQDKQEGPFKGPSNFDYLQSIGNPTISPEQSVKKLPSLADRNKLGFSDIAPEIGTLLSNIQGADFVQGQQYDPTLYTPYQVSFQDRLNENNAQLKAMERLTVNNPSAMATLAAQNYQANNSVLGEQFRTNQGITNDVINKNVSIINDAEMKNIGLRDQQYARQAQADANTKQQIFDAMSSISNKFSKNKKENVDIRLKENMFPNFRPSEDGKYEMTVQGERYMFDPLTNTMTPMVTSKKEVVKDGDKTTTTEFVQANKRLTKKWGGWI